MPVSAWEIVAALAVTLIAAAAQGVVGIGFAVVSVPTLALINPLLSPVPQILMVFPLTLAMAWRERAHVDLKGMPWLLAGRVPGVIIGFALLTVAVPRTLDLMIATMVLAGVAIRAGNIAVRKTHAAEFAVGTFAGTASMVASIGGPPMALLYQDEQAATMRSTLAVVFTIGVALTVSARAFGGLITKNDVQVAAMLLPAMLAGYALSLRVAQRVSDTVVRRGILVVSTVAALGLVLRAV